MSITDELREYANGWSDRGCFKRLIAIADRIDEQREKDALGEYTRGYNAGFNAASDGCESADELRERMEREYTKLPVDADGVPIHMGDVMEWSNGSFTVHELKLTEDGWQTWDSKHGYTVYVNECHHHAPTVEDVLREFAEHWNDPAHYAKGELVETTAAKLRLAGEAE